MDAPMITLVKRATWTGNAGDPYVHERFEVRGGDIAPHWWQAVRVPHLPWCEVTIWNEGLEVSGYGGEVWPSAWPDLFRIEGPVGRERTTLTEAGARLFSAARQGAP